MSSCCCDFFQMDGSCMLKNELIANCSGLFNSATAMCNNSTHSDFVCWIQDCPKEEEEDLIPFYLFLIFGAICYAYQFYLNCCSKKKANDENQNDCCSLSLHDLGHFFEIGTYLIILGAVMKHFKTTLFVTGGLFVLPYLLGLVFAVIYETVMKPFLKSLDRNDETSDVNAATKDDDYDYEKIKYEVGDIYLDVASSKIRVFATFLCQAALLAMYAYLIFNEGKPNFASIQAYLFYFLGSAIQMVKADQWTIKERSEYYKYLKKTSKNLEKRHEKKENKSACNEVGEVFLRMICAYSINLLGRDVLLLLLPLHLAQSEDAMDFVLNGIAAYFILDLDDLKDPKPNTYTKKKRKKKDREDKKDPLRNVEDTNDPEASRLVTTSVGDTNNEEKSPQPSTMDWKSTNLSSKNLAIDLSSK